MDGKKIRVVARVNAKSSSLYYKPALVVERIVYELVESTLSALLPLEVLIEAGVNLEVSLKAVGLVVSVRCVD